MTGSKGGDIALGFMFSFLMLLSLGTGIVVVPVACYFTGKKYPALKTGMVAAMILGAFGLALGVGYTIFKLMKK